MAQGSAVAIEAAGGVAWRPAPAGPGLEVALVHRPKYDDWSLPKGKLRDGEHPVLAAVREVAEESGAVGVPGRPLGETRYDKDGLPKRVRYWALRVQQIAFQPNSEVDQVMWVPPREGQRHLAADRDRPVLAAFAADPTPTRGCLLVRHGSAGERGAWPGDDRERPLDELGQRQALSLADLLVAYQVDRLLSADVARCVDTLRPYATATQLTIESEPLVSETGFAAHPKAAVDRLLTVLAQSRRTAVCSQGKALPGLLTGLCAGFGRAAPGDPTTRKAGFWAVHLTDQSPTRLVDLERFPAVD